MNRPDNLGCSSNKVVFTLFDVCCACFPIVKALVMVKKAMHNEPTLLW